MRFAKWWVRALTLFFVLAGALSASAQRLDGDMSGEVKDAHGLMVAGAKVTIMPPSTLRRNVILRPKKSFYVPAC